MPNINNCTIIGHAGRDAESRVLPSGKKITEISVAVTNGYGEHKKTVWTKIKIIGNASEFMGKARKGDLVGASGMTYCVDEVDGKNGKTRFHYFLAGIGSELLLIERNKHEGIQTQAHYDDVVEKTEDAKETENLDLPF